MLETDITALQQQQQQQQSSSLTVATLPCSAVSLSLVDTTFLSPSSNLDSPVFEPQVLRTDEEQQQQLQQQQPQQQQLQEPQPPQQQQQRRPEQIKRKHRPRTRRYQKLSLEARAYFIEDAHMIGVPKACLKWNIPSRTGYNLASMWDARVGLASLERMRSGPEKGTHRKITPEIDQYLKLLLQHQHQQQQQQQRQQQQERQRNIDSKCTAPVRLSGSKLSELVWEKFGVKISKSTLNYYRQQLKATESPSSTPSHELMTGLCEPGHYSPAAAS